MKVIRDLGADPDEIVRRADETVEYWRQHPDARDYAGGLALDEDDDVTIAPEILSAIPKAEGFK